MSYKITLDQAREIRKWYAANVYRVHNGTARHRDLRVEVGDKYGLSPRTIEEILTHRSHREPVA